MAKSREFLEKQWPKIPGNRVGTKSIGIRFRAEVVEFLNSLPDRQQFVRDAVDAAIARHLGTLPSELRADDGESDEVQPGAD